MDIAVSDTGGRSRVNRTAVKVMYCLCLRADMAGNAKRLSTADDMK